MEENKNIEQPNTATENKAEQWKKIQEQLVEDAKSRKEKLKEANEAIGEGKGVFHLETPIKGRDGEIKELEYDFMALTGIDFTDAMDSSTGTQQIFGITNRQALALFAIAAAKQTEALDMRDILERIGVTDAIEAVQLATIFFRASSRAGRMRITKKQ